MGTLFQQGQLRDYFEQRINHTIQSIRSFSEDEFLSRSNDDILFECLEKTLIEAPTLGTEIIAGDVGEETKRYEDFMGRHVVHGLYVTASLQVTGDVSLFRYRPSTYTMASLEGTIRDGLLEVQTEWLRGNPSTEEAQAAIARKVEPIRRELGYVINDVNEFNSSVEQRLRNVIEARKNEILTRRNLAGALGFPLSRRTKAPHPVTLSRRPLPMNRHIRQPGSYSDEPALTNEQYEEVLRSILSTMLAMERNPSVSSGKHEEILRDQILVQLNGTFEGAATGETFVQNGKTDILVILDNRHVFVGECKWWSGSKAFSEAIDQLLSYLPWRDEKAALILFVDRKDASSVFDKVDQAVRYHNAFKRPGIASEDVTKRRNYVLGQPDDLDREIYLAVLFAVLPRP